ncbi:MAG: hypothetical protein GY949_21325 [Gammaproteobacteria bacterium]|nr:hypothetical protein [Gammaproteobacteria bacterium]
MSAHVWLGQIAEGKNPFEEDDNQAREKLTTCWMRTAIDLWCLSTLSPKSTVTVKRRMRDFSN